MTLTNNIDVDDFMVGSLLQLDPIKIVNHVATTSKDAIIFDRLKEFSSKLAHHIDLIESSKEQVKVVATVDGAKQEEKKEEEEEETAVPTTTTTTTNCQKVLVEASTKEGNNNKNKKEDEEILRYDLAVAHRLTAKLNMDMLVWNHISARFHSGCLITPGRQLWCQITPNDLVYSSSNVTADIIHSALYSARTDIKAIIHLHTPAATAVSCLKSGFVPLTQDSSPFYNKVANYKWDGISNDVAEGPAIVAAVQSVPNCNTLLMHNHGFVCFGESVKQVWVLAYFFERACQIQLELLKTGAEIMMPDKQVMEKAGETTFLPEFAPGACEWDALCKTISFI